MRNSALVIGFIWLMTIACKKEEENPATTTTSEKNLATSYQTIPGLGRATVFRPGLTDADVNTLLEMQQVTSLRRPFCG